MTEGHGTTRETVAIANRIVALWLFALTVAGIVYGSLYPFDFDFGAVARSELVRALLADWQADSGFGDVLANLVLFLPFGLFGSLAFMPLGTVARWGLLLGGGALLACSLQVLQLWLPQRVPELADAALNLVGMGVGIALASLPLGRLSGRRQGSEPLAFLPALLLGCWLAYLWFPYVPSLDWFSIKQSLKPLLLEPRLEWMSVLRHTVAWLVFAALGRECRLGEIRIALMAIGAVFVQVPIADNVLELDDILGAVIGLAIWAGLRVRRNPFGPVLFLLFVQLLIQGLWPLEWQRSSFDWMPFRGLLEGSMLVNLLSLLLKLYFYGALIWLIHRLTHGSHLALVVPAAFTLALEVAQTRLAGHTPEVADPLLCVLIWSVVRTHQHRGGPGPVPH